MDEMLSTLQPILDARHDIFGIRELSRLTGINHTTVRQRLLVYEKKGYVVKKSDSHFSGFTASDSYNFVLLKKYSNMKKLYESDMLTYLNKEFDYPTIILFGSYANADDVLQSDIDICVITSIEKELSLKMYEKKLGKAIQIHLFSENKWKMLIKNKHDLVNSIANGIVLAGHLEVV